MCVYPRLSDRDYGLFRVGGPGLANCMLIAARAYVLSRKLNCEMLRPTWERIGIGQWWRGERDKRFYNGLFRNESVFNKLRKACLIRFGKNVKVEEGLKNFFGDILDYHDLVQEWFDREVCPAALKNVPGALEQKIAVHIRLGDYRPPYLTSIVWYRGIISSMIGKARRPLEVLLFSDGTDEQLKPITEIVGVRRVFFGNALADIVAISRCALLIGSDSTFSGWGAYLGQIPSVFPHLHYSDGGIMLKDKSKIAILNESEDFPDAFVKYIQ